MKAIIEIDMDSSAFEHNRGGELARILSDVSDKVNLIHNLQHMNPVGIIRDINGNAVGNFRVDEGASDADCPFKIQRVAPMPYPAEDGPWVLISSGIPAGGPLLEKWLASVNVVPRLDGATIVRANEMEADFYTDTPQEMKRILTAHSYPTDKMLITSGVDDGE